MHTTRDPFLLQLDLLRQRSLAQSGTQILVGEPRRRRDDDPPVDLLFPPPDAESCAPLSVPA
ncbi:MAG: hypothetical protein JSR59_12360 [Proteobacteria bacterium]|nr:hypothetical protein [Pseudomonadota bacterium]